MRTVGELLKVLENYGPETRVCVELSSVEFYLVESGCPGGDLRLGLIRDFTASPEAQ